MKNINKIKLPLIFLVILTCSIQAFSNDCETLIESIEDGNMQTANKLLQKTDINCKVPLDGTPLIAAVKTGSLTLTKTLVEKFDADVNIGILGDGNPLIQASQNGFYNIAKYLVKKGANVNAVVNEDETPLINASVNGHLKIVKLLISNGADVNKSAVSNSPKGKEIRTPLSMARKSNNKKVESFLIKNGAIR